MAPIETALVAAAALLGAPHYARAVRATAVGSYAAWRWALAGDREQPRGPAV